jgi:hypothetical protein
MLARALTQAGLVSGIIPAPMVPPRRVGAAAATITKWIAGSVVVSGGGENGVNAVAISALEIVATHPMVGLEMADHGLDGSSASHLAANDFCDAADRAANPDPEPVGIPNPQPAFLQNRNTCSGQITAMVQSLPNSSRATKYQNLQHHPLATARVDGALPGYKGYPVGVGVSTASGGGKSTDGIRNNDFVTQPATQ